MAYTETIYRGVEIRLFFKILSVFNERLAEEELQDHDLGISKVL